MIFSSKRYQCSAEISVLSTMPILTMIVGYPGSGKTTCVRAIVHSDPAFTGVTDGKIAWVESNNMVVFGRWKGFHKDTKIAGRLDGTDRIHASQFKKCVLSLAEFARRGVTHVVAEGFLLFKPMFVVEAERLGYHVRVIELSTSPDESKKRLVDRDGASAKIQIHEKWAKMRAKWAADSRWKVMTNEEVHELFGIH